MTSEHWVVTDADVYDETPTGRPLPGLVSLHFVRSALRRRWLVCVLFAVLGLLLATAYLVTSSTTHLAKASLVLAHDPQADSSRAMSTDVSLLTTRTVASKTIESLGLDITPDEFLQSVTADPVSSDLLSLSLTAPSNAEAVRRLAAFTSIYLNFRAEQLSAQSNLLVDGMQQRIQNLQSEMADSSKNIDKLAAAGGSNGTKLSDAIAQRAYVQEQIETLQQSIQDATLRNSSVVSSSRVVDPAAVDAAGAKRRMVLTLASGLIGGAALGCGLVLFFAITSDRLRRRSDVAAALQAPLVSVGRIAPVPKRWLWLPHLHTIDGRHADERQRLARAIETELSAQQRGARLAVACIDNSDEVRFAVAAVAANLVAAGRTLAIIDLTERGSLVEVAPSVVGSAAALILLRPHGVPALASGPGDLTAIGHGSASSPTLEQADITLVMADLDPSVGADYLATWTERVMVAVTAGRSSAEKVRTVAELIRTAGLDLRFAALVRTERTDDSSAASFDRRTAGVTVAPVAKALADDARAEATAVADQRTLDEEQQLAEERVAAPELALAKEQIVGEENDSGGEQLAAAEQVVTEEELATDEHQAAVDEAAAELAITSEGEATADQMAAEEQPTEQAVAHEQLAAEQQAEERVATALEQSAEGDQPLEGAAAEKQPAEEQVDENVAAAVEPVAEEQPIEEAVAEEKPTSDEQRAAEAVVQEQLVSDEQPVDEERPTQEEAAEELAPAATQQSDVEQSADEQQLAREEDPAEVVAVAEQGIVEEPAAIADDEEPSPKEDLAVEEQPTDEQAAEEHVAAAAGQSDLEQSVDELQQAAPEEAPAELVAVVEQNVAEEIAIADDEKPAAEEHQVTEEQPTEEQPAEEQPAEEQRAEEQRAEELMAVAEPTIAEGHVAAQEQNIPSEDETAVKEPQAPAEEHTAAEPAAEEHVAVEEQPAAIEEAATDQRVIDEEQTLEPDEVPDPAEDRTADGWDLYVHRYPPADGAPAFDSADDQFDWNWDWDDLEDLGSKPVPAAINADHGGAAHDSGNGSKPRANGEEGPQGGTEGSPGNGNEPLTVAGARNRSRNRRRSRHR
jgi:hypothetical protein